MLAKSLLVTRNTLEKYHRKPAYCIMSSQRFAMMSARIFTLLLALASQGSRALQLGSLGRRAFVDSACIATCGAVLPAVAAEATYFKAYSGKVAFGLEQAAQMDAKATSRRVFSEVTEENRRARISFGSTGKILFEVPYELDGTVEFMWVKDSKGKVIAAKKIRQGESFPATLIASVPSGKVTVVAKCTDTLWEGAVTAP